MAFAAARMIKEKAKRPSMDLALYPVSNIFMVSMTVLIFLLRKFRVSNTTKAPIISQNLRSELGNGYTSIVSH